MAEDDGATSSNAPPSAEPSTSVPVNLTKPIEAISRGLSQLNGVIEDDVREDGEQTKPDVVALNYLLKASGLSMLKSLREVQEQFGDDDYGIEVYHAYKNEAFKELAKIWNEMFAMTTPRIKTASLNNVLRKCGMRAINTENTLAKAGHDKLTAYALYSFEAAAAYDKLRKFFAVHVDENVRPVATYPTLKKKKKTTTTDFSAYSPAVELDPNDPMQIFCICRGVSYGDMIACDNTKCRMQWFHFECVGIVDPPEGEWFCDMCKANMVAAAAGKAGKRSGKKRSKAPVQ